jgi:hypothetical protein
VASVDGCVQPQPACGDGKVGYFDGVLCPWLEQNNVSNINILTCRGCCTHLMF